MRADGEEEVDTRSTPTGPSGLRKLTPKALPPDESVIRSLSAEDCEILMRRLASPCECVLCPQVVRPENERALLGPMPASPDRPRRRSRSDDSGLDLLASDATPALTAEQERHLFLRFNLARYRVMKVLHRFRGAPLTGEAARRLIRWERLTIETREQLIRSNVALVLAMAKRTKITGVDHADLISEGNMALLRSVDKFDCSRGYKFSTYACRSILKAFSRVATRTTRYRSYFPTEFDPTLEKSDHVAQKRKTLEENCVSELRSILGSNLANLNEIEQRVLRARFALDEDAVPASPDPRAKTLEQVGELIGVTKERVRQIQNKALDKLRVFLQDTVLTS